MVNFVIRSARIENLSPFLFLKFVSLNLEKLNNQSISFRNANKRTIQKAYRKLAQKWHPDNFSDEKEKKAAEKKFIDIAAAKEVLSDEGTLLLK